MRAARILLAADERIISADMRQSRGVTQLHPEMPEKLRGAYAGLASETAIRHLTNLGVTAVELLPVHHLLNYQQLIERELGNYWGYNTLACLTPESRYAAPRRWAGA